VQALTVNELITKCRCRDGMNDSLSFDEHIVHSLRVIIQTTLINSRKKATKQKGAEK
jgi:hypothetical protein